MKLSEYKFMPEKPNTPELVKLFDRILSYTDFNPDEVYKLIYDHLPKMEQEPDGYFYIAEDDFFGKRGGDSKEYPVSKGCTTYTNIRPYYLSPQPKAVEQVELKHEPLSIDVVMSLVGNMPWGELYTEEDEWNYFARAIEKSHGIGVE